MNMLNIVEPAKQINYYVIHVLMPAAVIKVFHAQNSNSVEIALAPTIDSESFQKIDEILASL